jgi:hypothetical protein
MSHINSYFFRKEMISLPLKVGGAPGELKRGKKYIIINVPEVVMGGINMDFKGVLRLRVLPFKRFLDICY